MLQLRSSIPVALIVLGVHKGKVTGIKRIEDYELLDALRLISAKMINHLGGRSSGSVSMSKTTC
jgi:hypothetical protein